jgi:hypothetical protein
MFDNWMCLHITVSHTVYYDRLHLFDRNIIFNKRSKLTNTSAFAERSSHFLIQWSAHDETQCEDFASSKVERLSAVYQSLPSFQLLLVADVGSVLVSRANEWLRLNPHLRAKTCESIEVKGRLDGVVDTNKSCYFEADHAKRRMRNIYIRALR